MLVKYRYFLAALLLPVLLTACDWGTSRLQPPDPEEPTPLVGHTPPADRLSRHRLGNGVTVLVLPDAARGGNEQSFVYGRLRLPVGSAADPEGQEGLALWTAHAVRSALPGGRLHYEVEVDAAWTDFTFRAPKQTLETALSYLHFALVEAEFDAERIAVVEQELLQNPPPPPSLLEQAIAAFAQPKVYPVSAKLTAPVGSAMRRFYAEHYGSRDAILAISPQRGSDWLDAVSATLGRWQPQPADSVATGQIHEASWQPRGLLQADEQQRDWIGFAPGLRWDHPDMAALMVAEVLLLNTNWKMHWQGGYQQPGWFTLQPIADSDLPIAEQWQQSLQQLKDADRMLAARSQVELERALVQASNRLFSGDGSMPSQLSEALLLEFNGYPRNFADLMEWSISKLQLDDVRAAVRRHLRPDQLRFYAHCTRQTDLQLFESVGEVGWVGGRPQVALVDGVAGEPLGPVEGDEDRADEIDPLEQAEPTTPLLVGEAWADQILQAHGGRNGWQAADLFTVRLRRTAHNGKAPSSADLVLAWPDALRYRTTAASGNVVVVRGDHGWLQNAQRNRTLDRHERGYWRDFRNVLLSSVLMELARGDAQITESLMSGDGLQLHLKSGRSLGLKIGDDSRIAQIHMAGMRVDYQSYQQVHGLWLPTRLHLFVTPSQAAAPGWGGSSANRSKPRQWEQWDFTAWQVNPPRQAHWFEAPAD